MYAITAAPPVTTLKRLHGGEDGDGGSDSGDRDERETGKDKEDDNGGDPEGRETGMNDSTLRLDTHTSYVCESVSMSMCVSVSVWVSECE